MSKQLKFYSQEENESTNSPKAMRRLKVYYGSHHSSKYSRLPVIRLCGKYLRDFGFKIGDTIDVKLSEGHIEISKVVIEKATHSRPK